MAVVRITAEREWFRVAATSIRDREPRGSRELDRAADRRGLSAELTADEARALARALPGDDRARRLAREADESEERERARPRARDVAMGRVSRR